jgi:cyclase
LEKITDNVYAETQFRGCNPGFVVTREGVVMIDTPQIPTDAIEWRHEIAKHGPVRYLINTEPHGDHFTGNYFFDGTVVAHEGTREAIMVASVEQLKERLKKIAPDSIPLLGGFSYRLPTITLSQQLTLYIGEHTFQLIHLPGHTPYQVAVYCPQERVIFTSDNVFYRVQGYLSHSLPYEWLHSLKQMQELEADILVPGHGSICDPSYIPEMSSFIQAWIDKVTVAINQELSLEEAKERISLLDIYPMSPGNENMGPELQKLNVAHLYRVLKK